jgi:hypothetical protein
MVRIEALRHELIEVSQEVAKHKEVAEIAGISVAYLGQIRGGTNAKTDNNENIALIKLLISTYRKVGKDKIIATYKVIGKNKITLLKEALK